MRATPRSWLRLRDKLVHFRNRASKVHYRKHPRVEQLEDRRLLAVEVIVADGVDAEADEHTSSVFEFSTHVAPLPLLAPEGEFDGDPDGGDPDGGYPDGGYPDGGYPDGGYPDGGYPDGGDPDGGDPDGGDPDGGDPDGGDPGGDPGGGDPGGDGPMIEGPGVTDCEAPHPPGTVFSSNYSYWDEPRELFVQEGVEVDVAVATVKELRGTQTYAGLGVQPGEDTTTIHRLGETPLEGSPAWIRFASSGNWRSPSASDALENDYQLVGWFTSESSNTTSYHEDRVTQQSHVSYQAVYLSDSTYVLAEFHFGATSVDYLDCVVDPDWGHEAIHVSAQWFDRNDYNFLIDWSDGSTSIADLVVQPDGRLAVAGQHSYEWGDYHPTVRYQTLNSANQWNWAGSFYGETDVHVEDNVISIPTTSFVGDTEGAVTLVVPIGDADPISPSYHYWVTVDWGDGSQTRGSAVRGADGSLFVTGLHVYNQTGNFSGTIQVIASDNSSATGQFTAHVPTIRPGADDLEFTLVHDRTLQGSLLQPGDEGYLETQLHSGAGNGTVSVMPNGQFVYTPDFNFVGLDTFTYVVMEEGVPSDPATVTIDVINRAPEALDDSWDVPHGRRFVGNLLTNDRDEDHDSISATLAGLPSHGRFVLASDGEFEYTPSAGFFGTDQLTYRVHDGIEFSALATVELTVVNRLPNLDPNQSYSLPHDTQHTQGWAEDPDGDALQFVLRSNPAYGEVTFDEPNRTWTYTPNSLFTGTDTFSFSLHDGLAETPTAQIALDVYNNAPTGAGDSYSVPHDQTTVIASPGVLENDVDPDGDALTVTLVSLPEHGVVELAADGSFTYVPDSLYAGPDSFQYVVSDGIETTDPILVQLQVTSVPPVAVDYQQNEWPHDRTLIGQLTATDGDSDELFFELEQDSTQGTVHLRSTGEFAFSPNPGFTGTAVFTYRAFDGIAFSNTATATIAVIQDPPTAIAAPLSVSHDSQLRANVLVDDTDAQPDEYLTADLISEPNHGYLAFNSDGWFTYQPFDGFIGDDSFVYRAFDGRGYSTEVTQVIAVTNAAPVTNADEYFLAHNRTLVASLSYSYFGSYHGANGTQVAASAAANDYDSNGDLLEYLLVDPISGDPVSVEDLGLPGPLVWNGDGTFEFQSSTRSQSEVQFYYVATDGIESSDPTLVTIHVQDTAPVANADIYHIEHSLELRATDLASWSRDALDSPNLYANDENAEGDNLTITLIDPATGQTTTPELLDLNGTFHWFGDGTFTYQAELGYEGPVQFAYRTHDGVHASEIALVTIHVLRSGPTAREDQFAANHDTNLSGSVLWNDITYGSSAPVLELLDTDGQVVNADQLGLSGVLAWPGDGSFEYSPDTGFYGVEQFKYRIFDGLDFSEPATVTLELQNTVPRGIDRTIRVVPDQAYQAPSENDYLHPNMLLWLQDLQGDALTASVVSDVSHGTLNWLPDGAYSYTPDAGYRGTDGFTFVVSDGLLESEPAQIILRVNNSAPVAIADHFETISGVPFAAHVGANDSDFEWDPLSYTLLDPTTLVPVVASHFDSFGQFSWDGDGHFEFQSQDTFVGGFEFAYSISDGIDEGNVAQVVIDVQSNQPPNFAPVAEADRYQLKPDSVLTVPAESDWDGDFSRLPLTFNDYDLNLDDLAVVVTQEVSSGQLTISPSGAFTYVPAPGFTGVVGFQYELFDGEITSEQSVPVEIHVSNSAPRVRDSRIQLVHDTTFSSVEDGHGLQPTALDLDGDSLEFLVASQPDSGVLTLGSDGHFVYVPDSGFVGLDQFSFQVFDGTAHRPEATVFLEIVNDPPMSSDASHRIPYGRPYVSTLPAPTVSDQDPYAALVVGGPFYGSVDLASDGTFTYTPNPGFVGGDTFSYTWYDLPRDAGSATNLLAGNFSTIEFEVLSRAPVPSGDTVKLGYSMAGVYEFDVRANDTDPDQDELEVSILTQPEFGFAYVNPQGNVVYEPDDPAFYGTDRFEYRVGDGVYSSLPSEIELSVAPFSVDPSPGGVAIDERTEASFPVATLVTPLVQLVPSEFTASIDWGDGYTSVGTLSEIDGVWTVTSSHRYAQDGVYNIVTTLSHTGGYQAESATVATVADVGMEVVAGDLLAVTGDPTSSSTVVAVIEDDPDVDISYYSATIDWGDGTQSAGTVARHAERLVVQAGHLYGRGGTYSTVVTVTTGDGTTLTASGTVQVDRTVTVEEMAGPVQSREFDGVVGRFRVNSARATANDFFAIVNWGDGRSTLGQITKVGHKDFVVHGRHTYAEEGGYRISLTVTDGEETFADISATNDLEIPRDSTVRLFGNMLQVVEGVSLASDTVLAEFVDTRPAAREEYSAEIEWGNGHLSSGQIFELSHGHFAVRAGHLYPQTGTYEVTVRLSKSEDPEEVVTRSSVWVVDAPLAGMPTVVSKRGPRELVAEFTDENLHSQDFQARIRVQSGQYLPAEVVLPTRVTVRTLTDPISGGGVNGQHQFERQAIRIHGGTGGTFTLTLDDTTTAPISRHAEAEDIRDVLLTLPSIHEVHVQGTNGEFVVTFTGVHRQQDFPQLVADSSMLQGDLHTFQVFADTESLEPGDIEVQIFDADRSRLTIHSVFSPTAYPTSSPEAGANLPPELPDNGQNDALPLIELMGLTLTPTLGTEFHGAVATYDALGTDTSEWTAFIDWGDGTRSPGQLVDGEIRGSHTYHTSGDFPVSVGLAFTGAVDPSESSNWNSHSLQFSMDGLSRFPENLLAGYPSPLSSKPLWDFSWQHARVSSGARVILPELSLTPIDDILVDAGTAFEDLSVFNTSTTPIGTAVMEWGDGNISHVESLDDQILGSHTYANPGTYTARIRQWHGEILKTASVSIQVLPATPWPEFFEPVDFDSIAAARGQSLEDVVVAKFSLDTPERIGGLHAADIDWGDGHSSVGKIRRITGNTFEVLGTHTYRAAGVFPLKVTLQEQAYTAELHSTVSIASPNLSAVAENLQVPVGKPLVEVVLGHIPVSSLGGQSVDDYMARVNWGDGEHSAGKLTRIGDQLFITGSHTYADVGNYQFQVLLEAGYSPDRSVAVSGQADVVHTYEDGNPVDPFTGVARAGNPYPIVFDQMVDAQDLMESRGWHRDYEYRYHVGESGLRGWRPVTTVFSSSFGIAVFGETIDWQDGVSSNLKRIAAYHTHESSTSETSEVNWSWRAPPIATYSVPYFGSTTSGRYWRDHGFRTELFHKQYASSWESLGQGVGNATERDTLFVSNPSTASLVFAESIKTWNINTPGIDYSRHLQASFYTYQLPSTGSPEHVYESPGTYHVSTSFGVNRSISVADAPFDSIRVPATLLIDEGDSFSGMLATFSLSDWHDPVSELSAEIDWGDGSGASSGEIELLPNQRFAISGSHLYGQEGNYEISILLRSAGGASRIQTMDVAVVDRDLKATAQNVEMVAMDDSGDTLLAIIEDFTGTADSLVATVDWGDDEEPSANDNHWSGAKLILNQGTGKWEVWGSHTYTQPGEYEVFVQISDHSSTPLVVESTASVTDQWESSAVARHLGFGEGHLRSIAGTLVGVNTGDLLLAHDLDFDLNPGSSVGGTPQLVFNSATTNPRPIIQMTLASEIGAAVPTHFEARLHWNNQTPPGWQTFAGSGDQSGADYVLALQVPGDVQETGLYDWQMDVRIYVPGQSEPITVSERGQSTLVVQNNVDLDAQDPFDATAPLGIGWHLSTQQRLIALDDGDVILVNGYGYPRHFEKPEEAGSAAYELEGPSNEYGKLEFDPDALEFTYTAKDQVKTYFNHLGLMVRVERPGQPVEFYEYDDEGRLTTVRALDGAVTTFQYNGMRLVSITQPGGRVTGLVHQNGLLTRINDPNGTHRTFGYTAGNRLSTTNWGVLSTQFGYGTHGRLTSIDQGLGTDYQIVPNAVQGLQAVAQTTQDDLAKLVDPLGREHLFVMDAAGRLEQYAGPEDASESWQRNEDLQLTSHTTSLGTSTFDFDDQGNLTTFNHLGQGATQFGYDSQFNQVNSIVDPLGHSTTHTIDPATGFVSQTTNQDGNLTTSNYANGLLQSVTQLNGAVTNYSYDGYRRLQSETGPAGRTRSQTYDSNGNPRTTTDGNNQTVTQFFDHRNRLIQSMDAASNSTFFEYDASGLLTAKVEPGGRRTEYQYDRRGFLTMVVEGAGTAQARTLTTVYDAAGNPIEEYDALNLVTYHSYDDRNRRTQTIDAGLGVTTFVYNAQNQMSGMNDRAGREWVYHYDARGRRVGVTDPLGRTAMQQLSWNGLVLEQVDGAGRSTVYTYDGLYNRTSTTFAGQTVSFTYDDSGNVKTVTDPRGHTTLYDYDLFGNQVAMLDAQQNLYQTFYDMEGNAIGTTDPLGRSTVTTYDGLNRPRTHLDAAQNLSRWSYDEDGNLTAVQDAAGRWTTYDYDLHHRRIRETDELGNSNHYLYNGNDWLVSQTDRNGSTTQFTHTPLGQVASMTDPLAGGWGFTYDLAGNTLTQTDPLGRITRNEYDAGNRLLRAYDANDNLTRVEYDLADNVTKHVDPLLRETLFQYDAWDQLTHATDALQGTTVQAYDAVGNLLSLTDPLGGVTQFTYDALNRLTTSTDALGHVTTQAYDAAGNLQSVTDALGRVTTFGYDVLNRNTTVTNALGKASSRAYDAVGNVTHETDALGRVTTHAYDGLHRLIKTTDPALGETTWTYDAAGNVLTVSNPLGEVQSLVYDALGRVVSSSSPGFGTSSTDYDAVGNVIQLTNALGQVTSTSYDNLNRLVTLTDALNQTSQWVYDDVGNVLQSIDPLGRSTVHSYDALNRLLTTTDTLGHVTSYGYDSSGNRTSLTDSVGNETSWTYDAVGRVATETNQLGHIQSYTYDAVGNLARLTKRDGNHLNYTYDALNRRLTEAWETPAGALLETLHFGYDDAGQLTSAGDSQSTLVWSYDSLGRIVSETQNLDTGLEISLANAYDAAGRRTQLAASVNGVVDSLLEIDYYSGGLVHQMQHSGLDVSPKSVLYNYDVGGRTTSLHRYGDLANTELVAITEYEWDDLNRMQALDHTRAMTTLAGYDLVWDAASRLTSVDSLMNGLSEFAYDSVGQLISATYSNYANLSFSYDANGNRTGTGTSTGDDNQLLSTSDASYDNDENGNLVRRTDTSTGEVTEYSYDHRDRMTDVRFFDSEGGNLTKHVQYRYDALNRRIAELVDTDGNGTIDDTTTIVNDGLRTDRGNAGDHVLLHLDENGDVTNRYFHGAAVDEILAEESIDELTGDSDVLWALTDHQGSVRDLLRYDEATNTASVVDHVFFDAYGNIVAESNSNVDSLFGWTGREFDRHTGLQYNRARYYDSTTGRFTQKDPISFAAGDPNLYRYVSNSPTNATDPSGLEKKFKSDLWGIENPITHEETGLRYMKVWSGWSKFATHIGNVIYDPSQITDEQAYRIANGKYNAGQKFGALFLRSSEEARMAAGGRFRETGFGRLLGFLGAYGQGYLNESHKRRAEQREKDIEAGKSLRDELFREVAGYEGTSADPDVEFYNNFRNLPFIGNIGRIAFGELVTEGETKGGVIGLGQEIAFNEGAKYAAAGLSAWWASRGLSHFSPSQVDDFIDTTVDAWVASGKDKTFVIGEGQKRIGQHIRNKLGGNALEFRKIWPENMMFKFEKATGRLSAANEATLIDFNMHLVRRLHEKGFKFIDIGADGRKTASNFYEAEKHVLRQLGAL